MWCFRCIARVYKKTNAWCNTFGRIRLWISPSIVSYILIVLTLLSCQVLITVNGCLKDPERTPLSPGKTKWHSHIRTHLKFMPLTQAIELKDHVNIYKQSIVSWNYILPSFGIHHQELRPILTVAKTVINKKTMPIINFLHLLKAMIVSIINNNKDNYQQ